MRQGNQEQNIRVYFEPSYRRGCGLLRVFVEDDTPNLFFNIRFSLPASGRKKEIVFRVEGEMPQFDELLPWEQELLAPLVAWLVEAIVNPNGGKVVHYTRVSTTEQAEQGQSLPAQLGALRRYSKERGHQVIAEFEEPGASGRDANRPVFKQMLERILSPRRDVDAILVFQSSRFMRDVMESRVLKSKLKKHGVRVISISQETSDDATGTFVEGFFELVDQYESDINGTRTRAALRENARRGWFNGSSPPYGFQVTKIQDGARKRGKLVPCPEEKETILEVFHLYATGFGAKLVAQTLNERGLHYRKEKKWSRDLVLKVIEEKAVIGTYLYGKKQEDPIPVKVEAIVPVELFNLAAKVRADRDPKRYPGKQSSTRTLLSRLAACSSCGRTYVWQAEQRWRVPVSLHELQGIHAGGPRHLQGVSRASRNSQPRRA